MIELNIQNILVAIIGIVVLGIVLWKIVSHFRKKPQDRTFCSGCPGYQDTNRVPNKNAPCSSCPGMKRPRDFKEKS